MPVDAERGRVAPGCVVVAGMHRSGTSLTAGLLAALGIDLGRRFVPADSANPRGYFEDLAFVDFHRRLFRDCVPKTDGGHPDWGWTSAAAITAAHAHSRTAEAMALVARRSATGRLWGFKDPRATVLLDFWHPLLPAPVYVAVYREPTGVADSMQRLGADVFLRDPASARSIWRFYNERLLDFVRRHRDQCVLLNIDALQADLARFPALLRERLGLPVPDADLSGRFAAELLRLTDGSETLTRLACHVWGDCAAIFNELESLADLPGSTAPHSPPFSFAPRRASSELSIVIPTHDDATWLVEAVASVEECAGEAHEILVLDDGTTDPESLRILDRLRAAGRPVLRQANAGLSAARNALIRAARGRYILPLDADNRLRPGFIEGALAAFRDDPGLGVVYGDRILVGARTGHLQTPDFNLRSIVHRNEIDACAMFRRDLWCDVGGYDTELRGFEDWEFWLHAGKRRWRFLHLPQVAFEYRVRPDSLLARCRTPAGYRMLRRRLWQRHADLLLELTPPAVRAVARVTPPYPADVRMLRGWQRLVLRGHWHLAWARAARCADSGGNGVPGVLA